MALTSRERQPLKRVADRHKDAGLIIIATEGTHTERQYFTAGAFRTTKIQVKILPTKGGRSGPRHVLRRLDEFKEEYDVIDSDEFWLMLDVDDWGDKKLSAVASEAIDKGYGLAISNPCFEVWLYLHFCPLQGKSGPCQKFKKLIRDECGSYNSSNVDCDTFHPHLDDALRRAKELHTNNTERWPDDVGSHVYKVVEAILTKDSAGSLLPY